MGNNRTPDPRSLPTSSAEQITGETPTLSICIVSLNSWSYLQDCLQSLAENTRTDYEVIITDNGSTDGTQSMLAAKFPGVRLIQNQHNEGYTRPMNQALQLAQGRFLAQLNPDTLILPGAMDHLISFLDAYPQAGICGPKVLNRDHTLQKPCRRGEPRPWAVICYFLGLSALFPKIRLFGEYLMSYKDEDETHTVAGVSGSCMLIRRDVVNSIGFLDERFFAYQEDADYCFRARQAGWKIYYHPQAQIIHYGGMGGSRVQPYRSIYEWHRSYFLYYRKNLARDYFFLFNWLYYVAMGVKLILSLGLNFIRRDKFAGSRKP
ncbi:MAG TPA: glycosyltransferase family 2 protein [Anaerolineales bacterium]|nr:glycosyltransferase family 2 protein [Anaerolineales bacterium]